MSRAATSPGPACPRSWEAEAVLDGRVSGRDADSWDRHAASCATCQGELRTLRALQELVRASTLGAMRPLESRRARLQLLERVDAEVTGRHPAVRPLRRGAKVGVLLLSLAAAAVAVWMWRSHEARDGGLALAGEPGVRFQLEGEGRSRRVRLDDGSLTLTTDHAAITVITPDGEVEDVGTVFTVTVGEGRTRRVSVAEGRVTVRLRGSAPFELSAGAAWERLAPVGAGPSGAPALPETSTAVAETPPSPQRDSGRATPGVAIPGIAAVPGARASLDAAARPRAVTTPPAAPVVASSVGPAPGTLVDGTAVELGAAMQALSEGQLADAATRFQRFEQRHPADPHAEDAAYLRAITLDRAGRHHAAAFAARDYLARYPRGFRRKEMETLAADRDGAARED